MKVVTKSKIGIHLISCLVYAGDISLLSNGAGGLQKMLNSLLQFCQRWNLKVNVAKTKIIIFNTLEKYLRVSVLHMMFKLSR